MAKILIVEDDENIAQVVKEALGDDHHTCDLCLNGTDALAYLRAAPYDLIILDWTLPDISGLEICTQFRAEGGRTAVLFLTGRNDIYDRVTGLDSGADDYLTKPFDMRELKARVRTLLRRPVAMEYANLKIRDIELDPISHIVTVGGEEIKLFPKEFAILELFMRNPQRIFSAEELLSKVWSTDSEAGIETIRTTLMRVRQKVESDPSNQLIRTIRGVGYKLTP